MKVHLVLKKWGRRSVCGKYDPPLSTDDENKVTCKVCISYIEGLKRRGLRGIYAKKKAKPTTPLSERNQPLI